MRFLKSKVFLKPDFLEEQEDGLISFLPKVEHFISTESNSTLSQSSTPNLLGTPSSSQEYMLPIRGPRRKPTCPQGNSKNIIKNYGKVLCTFASSALAVPYLESYTSRYEYSHVKIAVFLNYIKAKKEKISTIESLRKLLVVEDGDSAELIAYKKLFKELSIIFLKYFAVNWIFGGKLVHKEAHLKYRYRMLRRIQQPEHFTYLKASRK